MLTLLAGGSRHGVPSRMVREVARMPGLTRVPHAPAGMLGLANVRGRVMPVLSLAALTGRSAGPERRLVVLSGDEPIGMAVDGVEELLDRGQAEGASIDLLDVPSLIARSAAGRAHSRGAAGVETASRVMAAEETVSLVTFAIGAQAFALPLEAVDEVLRLPAAIAAVPNAEEMVLGSIDLRGALLPLLMLAPLLALPGDALSAKSRVLVVRIGAHRVGIVVDALHAVLRVFESAIDPVPLVLTRGAAEARIQAVCRLGDGRLVSVLAPAHLLREDLTARLLGGGSAPRAKIVEAEVERTEPFLLFAVGNALFGLPTFAVEHIGVLPAKLARIPGAAGFVRGAMPWRGEALPVIDQSKRLGAASIAGKRQHVIVVAIGALRAAFAVDAIVGLRRVVHSALRPMPVLDGGETEVFERVIADGDAPLTLLLDPEKMLDGAERDMLKAARSRKARRHT